MLANPSRICVVCEVRMFLIIDPIRVGGNLNESFYVVDLGAEGKEQREFKDKKTRIERMNNEQRKDNFIYVFRDTFTIITFTLTMYKLVFLYPRIYVDRFFYPNQSIHVCSFEQSRQFHQNHRCAQEVDEVCRAQEPQSLRSTHLQKQLATQSQVMKFDNKIYVLCSISPMLFCF